MENRYLFRAKRTDTGEHNFPIIKEINVSDIPTAYDPDKVVKQLEAVSYERYGNDGMGGELVVNLDDAVEIMKGDGVDG